VLLLLLLLAGDPASLSQENRALRAELQKLRDEKDRLSREVRSAFVLPLLFTLKYLCYVAAPYRLMC
jgi:hypothetical protein